MSSATPYSSSLVLLEIDGGIATITINRPEALNSINPAVIHQLQQAFDRAAASPEVRGIVIAGAGKAFIVGADLSFFVRNIESGDIARIAKFTEAGHALTDAIDACPKPVVAGVHGAAYGAGTEIALACDFVVATPGATFALPETSLGIYPGLGGTQRAPRKLGVGLAKWMIFTGKTISAADAWKIGLADEVVTAESLAEVARSLADRARSCPPRPPKGDELAAIEACFERHRVSDLRAGTADAAGSPAAARAMKLVASKPAQALQLAERLIDEGMRGPLAEGLAREIEHLGEAFSRPDTIQALRSRMKSG